MRERMTLGAVMLLTGMLCAAVTVIAAAWLDAVTIHERSAELSFAVQAQLQGKTLQDLPPSSHILSPLMLWVTFGIGAYLLVAGFLISYRALSSARSAGTA
jgi:hypothetical protein